MRQHFTCPVCGKDIENFADENDPKCPNCGSELKIYQLLDDLREEQVAKRNIWKPIAIIAIVAAVLFALLSASGGGKAAENKLVAQLRDSIKSLQENVNDLQRQLNPALKAPVTPGAEDAKASVPAPAESAQKPATTEQPAQQTQSNPAPTAPKGKKYYVIQKGDNFSRISIKLYGNANHIDEIAKLNGGKKSSNLSVGDSLIVYEP
ncbi:MAG: LysM peptidoglycan-binding domain-containing protein [Prevotella sp.]|nr:LysM peptidoglycan-binding domain-containing protein [Prevotella sp.]